MVPQERTETSNERLRSIEQATEQLAAGHYLVVVDDELEDHGGWLVRAAEDIEVGDVASMIATAGGSVRFAVSPERDDDVGPPTPHAGVSGWPVTPLIADPGGVLERRRSIEAATDLARLAGCDPAVGISTIEDPLEGAASAADARALARQHGYSVVAIADLIAYRLNRDRTLRRVASARLPTSDGEFQAIGYGAAGDPREHLALVAGTPRRAKAPLVCVHRQCRFGDTLRSLDCDCRQRLEAAIAAIQAEGAGVLIYLPGNVEAVGDHPVGNVDRDLRIAVQIISDLKLRGISLLSDDRREAAALRRYAVDLAGQRVLEYGPT